MEYLQYQVQQQLKLSAVKDEYITSAMASSTITVNGTEFSLKDNIALGKELLRFHHQKIQV